MTIYRSAVILLVALALPLSAAAMAHATFPDAKKLQPMPSGVSANISGNVNATTGPEYAPAQTEAAAPQQTTAATVPAAPSGPSPWGPIGFVLLVVALVLGGIWWYAARSGE